MPELSSYNRKLTLCRHVFKVFVIFMAEQYEFSFLKDAMISERELLLQVAAGDGAAFRHLFDQYRQTVFGFAYAHLRTEALADEITQEVFIKIWMAGDKLAEIRLLSRG
ncbi:hypothetical protein MKQ70_12200 [Chitinophaga sedimenti]|uniref:RNA polymerase sigma factor n=1 Tax=Chitinophaga sedimenti TaxID=2033606 RepID=UPI00200398D5|nr:sigma factor [Chitinophaga sedimenti]MCK7555737.1 hypothetical protein [Chitinophaga sedimenti]